MSWLKQRFSKLIENAKRGPRLHTYWNGERTPCAIVRVIVGKAEAGWWCAGLEGTEREAVRVEYGGSKFYLDNESHEGSPAGAAWGKVTGGMGSPRYGHRSLPVEREVSLTTEGT